MFLHTGLQNFVVLEEIEAMNSNVYSAPTKRAVRAAEQAERLIDHTEGRKTRSVIFLKSGAVVLSTVETATLVKRSNAILTGELDAFGADDVEDIEDAEEVEEPAPAPKAAAKAAPAKEAAATKTAPAKAAEKAPAKDAKAAAKGAGKKPSQAADEDIFTDLPE